MLGHADALQKSGGGPFGIELDPEEKTCEIRGEPDAMLDGSNLQVADATATVRLKSGIPEDSPIRIVSFVSPEFRGALVHVNVENRRIVVEMQAVHPAPLVLLIPEDPGQPAQTGVLEREGRKAKVSFENAGEGPYLLTVHVESSP